MQSCLFCKISSGELDAKTIYEDEIVKVFLDINPISVGHTLIVPKNHYLDLDDIPMEVLCHIMSVSKIVKKLIQERLVPDGMTLIQNNGFVQEIKHYHLHLVPKYRGSSKKLSVSEVYDILRSED